MGYATMTPAIANAIYAEMIRAIARDEVEGLQDRMDALEAQLERCQGCDEYRAGAHAALGEMWRQVEAGEVGLSTRRVIDNVVRVAKERLGL